jgi:hypothetical protein
MVQMRLAGRPGGLRGRVQAWDARRGGHVRVSPAAEAATLEDPEGLSGHSLRVRRLVRP